MMVTYDRKQTQSAKLARVEDHPSVLDFRPEEADQRGHWKVAITVAKIG